MMDIYAVYLCYETGTYTSTFRLDTRVLHNQISHSDSVTGILFTRFPAIQWYKVCLYVIDIHGVRFCYETDIYAGIFRLDAKFLYTQMTPFYSVDGRIFSPFPAIQQCKKHLYTIDIHGV